jgi:hypothetical protein
VADMGFHEIKSSLTHVLKVGKVLRGTGHHPDRQKPE